MNLLKKLYDMRDKKKADNKGFSLVELIIVIAIMAILVGIVGTQVIPYINKSKEAKDFQIINSYSTAATTAYSSNAEKVEKAAGASKKLTIDVYGTNSDTTAQAIADEIKELTGYTDINKAGGTANLVDKMGSTKGKKIAKIEIVIDLGKKKITTQAYEAAGAAGAAASKVFDEVIAEL